ncbi:hypothetical protein PIB30_081574 [Stylosanthes scabra]|uniref:Uncharacterized protein n=1 Tax=Stylosanthes scabra TaxID=79078 RepID=A0ABU6VSZ9_9FABA|nr:hypothetical protein [Stylosanthes scabra]
MEKTPEVQVKVPTEKPEIIAEIKNKEAVHHPPQSSKKHTRSSSKFLEVLACLEVNIPLLKHLKDTPTYVKTMRELLLKKKTVKKGNTVVLTKECSAIIQKKLAHQKERSGSNQLIQQAQNLQKEVGRQLGTTLKKKNQLRIFVPHLPNRKKKQPSHLFQPRKRIRKSQ